ncbi:MAG: metalloregulator ArsR/SmtB family transcription factor [Pseudomonadota bacterium]
MVDTVQLFKCLSDETRLNTTLLIYRQEKLCVCELVEALQVSQPKMSRHLAQLRNCGLLEDSRNGQWVFYSLKKSLPNWMKNILDITATANNTSLKAYEKNLKSMRSRPNYC